MTWQSRVSAQTPGLLRVIIPRKDGDFGLCNLFLVALVLCAPAISSAQVVISEIMYDPPGTDAKHEWVELFNAGDSAVDLSKWKISDGTTHLFNAPPKNGSRGSLTIGPGEYLVIAADATTFLNDNPEVSASVIDTSLSLDNTSGSALLVRPDNSIEDKVSYGNGLGGNGDGKTLQRRKPTSKVIVAADPTLGRGIPVAVPKTKAPVKSASASAAVADQTPATPVAAQEIPAQKQTANPQPHQAVAYAPAQSSDSADDSDSVEPATSSQVATVASAADASESSSPTALTWILALAGLVACVVAAVIFSRSLRKNEWDIQDVPSKK
jgi:hypothetical protein